MHESGRNLKQQDLPLLDFGRSWRIDINDWRFSLACRSQDIVSVTMNMRVWCCVPCDARARSVRVVRSCSSKYNIPARPVLRRRVLAGLRLVTMYVSVSGPVAINRAL